MAGWDVVPVTCDAAGNIDVADLRAKADRENKSHWFRGKSYDYDTLLALRAPGFAHLAALDEVTRHELDEELRGLWERERFTLNAVNDYLQAAFPPLLYGMEHVVINSMQQKELARRLGIPSKNRSKKSRKNGSFPNGRKSSLGVRPLPDETVLILTTDGVTCSATWMNGLSGSPPSLDVAAAAGPRGACHTGATGLVSAVWT